MIRSWRILWDGELLGDWEDEEPEIPPEGGRLGSDSIIL